MSMAYQHENMPNIGYKYRPSIVSIWETSVVPDLKQILTDP